MSSRSDVPALKDIVEAISRIERYIGTATIAEKAEFFALLVGDTYGTTLEDQEGGLAHHTRAARPSAEDVRRREKPRATAQAALRTMRRRPSRRCV